MCVFCEEDSFENCVYHNSRSIGKLRAIIRFVLIIVNVIIIVMQKLKPF